MKGSLSRLSFCFLHFFSISERAYYQIKKPRNTVIDTTNHLRGYIETFEICKHIIS